MGATHANITWTGDLPPGGKLVLGLTSVLEGGGQLNGRLPTADITISNVVPPTGLDVQPLPRTSVERIVITNLGSAPVSEMIIAGPVGEPVVVTVNVPAVPTVKVMAFALVIVGAFMLGAVAAFIPLTVTCVKVVRSARRDKARKRAGLPLNDLPPGNNGHQDKVR